MTIEVELRAERLEEENIVKTGHAYVTSVVLDKYGKKIKLPLPKLDIGNDKDKEKFEFIKQRLEKKRED